MGAVAEAGIMKGYPDGSFQPRKFITRAEAIAALYAAIDYENEEPDTPAEPVISVIPGAPDVTANDSTNKVYGMTTAMEYKLDDGQWVRYDADEFAKLDLSGKHTLLVRYAAEGNNPASPATTLRFTSPSGGGGGSVAKTLSVTDIAAPNGITVTFTCDVAGASVTWNGEELTGVTTVIGENTITVPAMTSGASNTLMVKKSGYKTFTDSEVIWYAPPVISNISISSSNPLDPAWAVNGDIITLTFTSNEPVEKLSNFKINSSNPDTFTSDGSNNYIATHLVDEGDPLTGQPVTFQINVENEHGIYSQTIEATTDGSQVMIIGLAKVNSVGSFGVNGGKVYAGYQYLYEDEPVSLAADNMSLIEVLEPGQTTFRSLTPDADPLLWFNMEKAAGDYYYMVKTTEGIPYIARLRWTAPETASLNATGGLGIHEGITYVEYEMLDAEAAKVSLAAGAVKLIAGKADGQWAALTPNTDSTLWFNLAKPVGEYPFLAVGSDDTIYTADLDWTAPKALEASATGKAEFDMSTTILRAEYQLIDGTTPINLSSYTKLYRILPDAETIEDLGEPDAGSTALWFSLIMSEGPQEGDYTYLLLKDGIWYTTSIPFYMTQGTLEPTGQAGVHEGLVYTAFELKDLEENPIPLTDANIDYILEMYPAFFADPEDIVVKNPRPDTDPLLWFNIEKPTGYYGYVIAAADGSVYVAQLNWTGITEITGYDAIPDVNAGTAGAATYADAAAVIAYLNSNIPAVTITGTTDTVSVSNWTDTDGYDPDTAGSYTFTGTLGTLPDGYIDVVDPVNAVTVEVVVALPAMTGTVEITGAAKFGETLTAVPTLTNAGTPAYQWNRDGAAIDGATALTYELAEADIGTEITVTATADGFAGTGSITSAPTAEVAKADGPAAPAAPSAASQTDTSVTLNIIAGAEYNVDGGEWKESPIFTGLTPETTYTFKARIKATATHNASAESAGTAITTEAALTYTIDVNINWTSIPDPYKFGAPLGVNDAYLGSQFQAWPQIIRTGTGDITNLDLALSGTNADAFEITKQGNYLAEWSSTLNDATPYTFCLLKPKDGLEGGTYTATVTVTADNDVSFSFNISFKVIASTPVTAVSNGIAAPTGTTRITLNQSMGLAAGDIVVKKDGTALAKDTDYTLAINTFTVDITFLEAAALDSTSEVTVKITKMGYKINGGEAITVPNNIPAS